jgi:NADPH-dependent ferric siderophore reductase
VWPLDVLSKRRIAPRMERVEFAGPDLGEFEWKRGQDLVLEIPTPAGIARRHYTVRVHDAARRTLSIDFFLHGEGVSGPWLDALRPGDRVNAVGPRGHTFLHDADWRLFVGDETCIPAIFAMLEGVRDGAPSTVFLEAASERDAIPLDCAAEIHWVYRDSAGSHAQSVLYNAVENFVLPQGAGFAHVIGETAKVRRIRHRLLERGIARDRIAAEGYWRPGRIGGHDHA